MVLSALLKDLPKLPLTPCPCISGPGLVEEGTGGRSGYLFLSLLRSWASATGSHTVAHWEEGPRLLRQSLGPPALGPPSRLDSCPCPLISLRPRGFGSSVYLHPLYSEVDSGLKAFSFFDHVTLGSSVSPPLTWWHTYTGPSTTWAVDHGGYTGLASNGHSCCSGLLCSSPYSCRP